MSGGREACLPPRAQKALGDDIAQAQLGLPVLVAERGPGEKRSQGWARPGPGADHGVVGKV